MARQSRHSALAHHQDFHVLKLAIGTALLRRPHGREFRRTLAALKPCAVLAKKSFALLISYQSLHSHLLGTKWCEGDSGPARDQQEIESKTCSLSIRISH
jgi:hypothetical protein